MEEDSATSHFPSTSSNETEAGPGTHAAEGDSCVGDRQRRIGERRSAGCSGGCCVRVTAGSTGGWSDCPSALSYRSAGANQYVAAQQRSLGRDDSTLLNPSCSASPSCNNSSAIFLFGTRQFSSMDCGGGWKGFRGVNGGELMSRGIACSGMSRHGCPEFRLRDRTLADVPV
jgi:hypothetical protein